MRAPVGYRNGWQRAGVVQVAIEGISEINWHKPARNNNIPQLKRETENGAKKTPVQAGIQQGIATSTTAHSSAAPTNVEEPQVGPRFRF